MWTVPTVGLAGVLYSLFSSLKKSDSGNAVIYGSCTAELLRLLAAELPR
jgi:hypothetical protein